MSRGPLAGGGTQGAPPPEFQIQPPPEFQIQAVWSESPDATDAAGLRPHFADPGDRSARPRRDDQGVSWA